MLKVVTREDVREIAKPLWLLINQTKWDPSNTNYDLIKCAALALISQFAYLEADEEERRNKHRAVVVPSEIYQSILNSEEISISEVLGSIDFPDVVILRTKRYVAILVHVRDLVLVGVRGTQDAYDWVVNLKVYKKKGDNFGIVGRLHAGFLSDAEDLAKHIQEYLLDKFGPDLMTGERQVNVYFSGHSLGGAIASILRHGKFDGLSGGASLDRNISYSNCYIFGSPRVGSKEATSDMRQPFATRRFADVVPHCPPEFLGFSDFEQQYSPTGTVFNCATYSEYATFAKWIITLALKKFMWEHSIERYRREVEAEVCKHPNIKKYWDSNPLRL